MEAGAGWYIRVGRLLGGTYIHLAIKADEEDAFGQMVILSSHQLSKKWKVCLS